VTFTYYPGAVTNTANARRVTLTFPEFGQYLLNELATDGRAKASAGYVVPCGFTGPRRDANAEPTRLAYLDWDDAPLDPAALAGLTVFAHTSDSHAPGAERWHVFLLLDREYTPAELRAAKCPWPGAHLRAASQPAFVPTMGDDIEWFEQYGRPLALSAWAPTPAAPEPRPGPYTPPARKTYPTADATNALAARWHTNPSGTNQLAGAVGAVLGGAWGWSDDEVTEYFNTWLQHPSGRHLNSALRAAERYRAGDRIVGFPTLARELGREYDAARPTTPDDLWALVDSAPPPGAPGPDAPPDDPDGWGWEYGTTTAEWDPPPVPWLCEALCLAPGAPGLITGYGGSGKTTFVQHLALAVASGGKLLDAYPVRQGAVTHIDYEQGADLTRRRYLQLGLSDLPTDAQARLRFRSFPKHKLSSDPAVFAALLRAARGQALLIVDSLVASGGTGEDENAAAARDQLDTLTQVSELTGCTVLVIHHSKKDRSNSRISARGSSAITDAVSVHATYEKDDELGATSPATLVLQKVRHIMPQGGLSDPVTIAQSGAGRLTIVDPDEAANRRMAGLETEIVNLLATGWSGSTNDLVKELKRKRNDVFTSVAQLETDGLVTRSAGRLSLTAPNAPKEIGT
jgi:hypothetical protein